MGTDDIPTTLSTSRAFALVAAAVAISVAASLIATGDGGTAASATETGSAPAVTQPVAASTSSAAPGFDADVLPTFTPKADLQPAPADEVNVAVAPNVPPAATRSGQAIVDVAFEVVEGVSTIDPAKGTRTMTWGYRLLEGDDGVVVGTPGPIIRARVGDILRFTITNPAGNTNPHNIDLHAVTGQGGGAENTTVAPGETRTIEARMLYPGFFLYHCAYGDVPAHLAHGMYGGILIDPATPLHEVDHEWYVVQSEYYLGAEGADGLPMQDRAAISAEAPTHVVFNGAVGSLTGDNALQMDVGQRARIYFANAGLNLDSNFHPIGSHWDAVYQEAALLNPPLRGSQTTLVAAGGATVVELVGQVPQTVVLVDHALSRAFDKGAIGQIVIAGDENAEIFEEVEAGTVTTRPTAPPTEEAPATAAGDGAQHEVTILPTAGQFQEADSPDEFAGDENPADYSENVLEIAVGDTVTWTNTDETMMHTVTAVDGSFDSGMVASGATFSHTFTEAGEFEYFCTPHPWMRAKVVVR